MPKTAAAAEGWPSAGEALRVNKRVPELDGVRGVAILLVLVWHYIASQAVVTDGTLASQALRALAITWSGVDLFFVLSGFLIVGILLDAKGGDAYFSTFYMRRACRIVPLYLLMVSIFAVVTTWQLHTSDFLFKEELPLWSYFTFTQNFFMHGRGFGPHWLGVTWSLAIEEQFYLVVPLLVHWLDRKKLLAMFLFLILAAHVELDRLEIMRAGVAQKALHGKQLTELQQRRDRFRIELGDPFVNGDGTGHEARSGMDWSV